MRQRGLLLLLAAIVLSGCGSQTSAPAEEAGLEPAPPIEAVDEPAPKQWEPGFELVMPIPPECERKPDQCTEGESGCFYASNRPGAEESWSGECTPEEIKRIQELVRSEAQAHEPAPDSERRVVARLQLAGLERVDLIAWRTQAGKLCYTAELHPKLASEGPLGPCQPRPGCPEICLAEFDNIGLTYAGTVSPRADEIRFVLDGGETRRFPLVGPLVPGFEWRIFMVHLGGSRTARRIELFREGDRVPGHVRPATDIRVKDCSKQFDENDAGFQTCPGAAEEPQQP
jgi:hypothetical protein